MLKTRLRLAAMRIFWGLCFGDGAVEELWKGGVYMTVIISSHILSELENTADYIGIIANGQIQREAAIKDIQENFPSGLEEYFFEAMRGDKTE